MKDYTYTTECMLEIADSTSNGAAVKSSLYFKSKNTHTHTSTYTICACMRAHTALPFTNQVQRWRAQHHSIIILNGNSIETFMWTKPWWDNFPFEKMSQLIFIWFRINGIFLSVTHLLNFNMHYLLDMCTQIYIRICICIYVLA